MDDTLTAFQVQRYRDGELDIEHLATAATVAWWAWEALREVAPDRATFPCPKRPRGADPTRNLIRDIHIFRDVEWWHSFGYSIREACRITAGYRCMEFEAVRKVHAKERRRRSGEKNIV